MKLKTDIKLVDFLKTARLCNGKVCYKTAEGDVLNLKSQLSQYVFLAVLASDKDNPLPNGEISCENGADYSLLIDFLEP